MQTASFYLAPIDEKPLWLKHVIDSRKSKSGVKLLSAILLYGYRNQLPLIDLCSTRHDINNRVDNYLNLATGDWIMNSCTVPKIVTISKDLLDVINSIKGDTWIYGDGSNKTNNLVIAFKTLYGISYLEAWRQLKPEVKVKVKVEPEVEVAPEVKVEVVVKVEPEPIEEPVSSGTVRSQFYDWEYFNNEPSDKIHIKRVKALMDNTFSKSDVFYHSLIDCQEGITKVKSVISQHKSLNTQVNILNSLCKFLERTMATHYNDFTLLKDQISLQLKQHNAARSILDYQDILAKLESVHSKTEHRDLQIMVKLLQCISNYTEMNVGACRFSDVANTRLVDDGDHHFLDLENRVWHLRKNHTKNKTDRTAKVSDEFAEFIMSLNLESDKPLICPSGKTDGISKRFLKQVGVNYTDARASYVTYLDSVCDDVETIRLICANQGHKLSTALESYRRVTPRWW
jgi:hypothetical protein